MEDRRIGVAVDFSKCSKEALKWTVDNIIRKGDNLILINIQPEGYYEEGEMQLWETTGSPLIPLAELSDPAIMKKYKVTPDPETLEIVNTAAAQKEAFVIMKIFWGDPREKLCEAIDNIPLSCIVIGNRGLGKLKRVIMGSVSNYVVNNAKCPVTVVKHHSDE
ncbi:universal stress protein PHOS32-like [Impatiens glandulifera]|uniref:universal stress protein PHOS32-like n=1 Tax=Impatiens glandulifera TaxID=253017 RepID=UPI001FB090A7|nr:universal stress protein PHOS32-like [Impatiens glandulifera]